MAHQSPLTSRTSPSREQTGRIGTASPTRSSVARPPRSQVPRAPASPGPPGRAAPGRAGRRVRPPLQWPLGCDRTWIGRAKGLV